MSLLWEWLALGRNSQALVLITYLCSRHTEFLRVFPSSGATPSLMGICHQGGELSRAVDVLSSPSFCQPQKPSLSNLPTGACHFIPWEHLTIASNTEPHILSWLMRLLGCGHLQPHFCQTYHISPPFQLATFLQKLLLYKSHDCGPATQSCTLIFPWLQGLCMCWSLLQHHELDQVNPESHSSLSS